MDFDYLEWIEFMVRWFHVIAGIAWIGSSFYFIALDLSLRKSSSLPKEAHGEAWQVHGGGFYNLVKYLVAPNHLPDHLTWFKWEAYATWITGAALFILVYYLGAELYLIDWRGEAGERLGEAGEEAGVPVFGIAHGRFRSSRPRHPGLVPGSTVRRVLRRLVLRRGGPRDKPGVTG